MCKIPKESKNCINHNVKVFHPLKQIYVIIFLIFLDYNFQKMGCQMSSNVSQTYQINYKFSLNLFPSKSQSPNNPEVSSQILNASQKDLIQYNLERSIAYYQDYLSHCPIIKYPFDGLGNIEDCVGLYENRVEEWYRQSRQNGLINGNPYDALSLCYSIKADVLEGKKWYEEMILRYPTVTELHFGLGNICYKIGLYQQAESSFRQCIDLNPRLDKAYQNIANIYCFKKYDNSHAEEWAKFALRLNQNNQYADLIKVLVVENTDLRTHMLLKLIEKYERYTRIHNALGSAYIERNMLEAAKQWFIKGSQINPNYFALQCGLAIAYNKTKQFDESIRCSEKALSLNPNHHEPYGSLADSLVGKGCLADAEKWYLKCIEINKDFDVAYLELAKIYRSSNPTEAIKYFENYIQTTPDNTSALYDLGKLYLKLKQPDKGIQLLMAVLQIKNHHEDSLYLLGSHYKQQKKFDEAISYFTSYLQVSKRRSKGIKKLIEIYKQQGQDQKVQELKQMLMS